MSRKGFNASEWFGKQNPPEAKNIERPVSESHDGLADFSLTQKANNESGSQMDRFFIPGWQGGSLASKDIEAFKTIVSEIHRDVKNKIFSLEAIRSKSKQAIFSDFLNFAEFNSYYPEGIENFDDLFKQLFDEHSTNRDKLDEYLNIYSFRVCAIYVLKVRFVAIMLSKTNRSFDKRHILHINSYLTNLFKKSSSIELNSEAIKQNIFSWYTPSVKVEHQLEELYSRSEKLSVGDVLKNLSIASEKILGKGGEYSHSISHRNFGLYLNSLLLNFPKWKLRAEGKSSLSSEKQKMEVVSTHYEGDFLESLSTSHWLAQDYNKNVSWSEIIAPKFETNHSYCSGEFTAIINELQFLTFLAEIAERNQESPDKFVSKITRVAQENISSSSLLQEDLLKGIDSKSYRFDRVVVNLSKLPKSNPQHYVINQLTTAANKLKDDGFIFLFSTKKLFIPSQKERLESMLSEFHLNALFDFSDVEGIGEIGKHLYIFSRNNDYFKSSTSRRDFLNFRYSGVLHSFQEFEKIISLTHQFFQSNLSALPSMSASEYRGIGLNFFKDAIVDGRMVNTSNEDSGRITHPKFFNSIVNNCISMDQLFDLRAVNGKDDFSHSYSLNVSESALNEKLVIVDMRAVESPSIEFVDSKQYEARVDHMGLARCFYFKASPLVIRPDIDFLLNGLNVFFESSIGKQLIVQAFNGQLTKIKSNLNKLFVPRFLHDNTTVSFDVQNLFSPLDISGDQILEIHPNKIKETVDQILNHSATLGQEYSYFCFTRLAAFRKEIHIALANFERSQESSVKKINFNNPIVKTPLLLGTTNKIYPERNEDLHVEVFREISQFHDYNLTGTQKSYESIGDTTVHTLELLAKEGKILSIYSDSVMIDFVEMVLSRANGYPIGKIISELKVPELSHLKQISQLYFQLASALSYIESNVAERLNQISLKYITKK